MNRAILKENAKLALRDNFTAKMLLFIIPIIAGIMGTGSTISYQMNMDEGHFFTLFETLVGVFSGLLALIITAFVAIISAAALFNYIKIYRGERKNPQFSNVFIPFRDGTATKILAVKITRAFILFVLMFIPIIGWIAAIYFGLGWSQATFVLFDQIEEGRYSGAFGVLRESSEKMHGWRVDYFIFIISFFWWYVAQGITGGLIGFWTIPYINMAHVSYYEELIHH